MAKKQKFPSKKELDEIRKKLDKGMASKLLSANASPVDRVKYDICEKFVIYKNAKKLTQRELAELLGIDEALMSKIIHYHIDEFTTDRLLKYLSKIFTEVDVKVEVA